MSSVQAPKRIPPLENGDRLMRAEFDRRYEAMPHVKKAELIEGEVFMGSPVRLDLHGEQRSKLITWLGVYEAATPGTVGGDNITVLLDPENEPQPDAVLMIRPEHGGQVTMEKGYVAGPPELMAEIAGSTKHSTSARSSRSIAAMASANTSYGGRTMKNWIGSCFAMRSSSRSLQIPRTAS